jgi:hypothetical protein
MGDEEEGERLWQDLVVVAADVVMGRMEEGEKQLPRRGRGSGD